MTRILAPRDAGRAVVTQLAVSPVRKQLGALRSGVSHPGLTWASHYNCRCGTVLRGSCRERSSWSLLRVAEERPVSPVSLTQRVHVSQIVCELISQSHFHTAAALLFW